MYIDFFFAFWIGFENLAKKKTINTVTQVQERKLENQKGKKKYNNTWYCKWGNICPRLL